MNIIITMDKLTKPWLMLTGHHKAGKTWLFNSFQGRMEREYSWTCGIDLIQHDFTTSNGSEMSFAVCDSPGHEKFETLTTKAYFGNVSGFLLVFDITDEVTFQQYTMNKWYKYINTLGRDNVCVILVGTKCDMEEKRQVSRDRAQVVADDYGLRYFEVSSVTRHNVDLVFQTLANDVLECSL